MSELFDRSYLLEVSLVGWHGVKIDSSIKPSMEIEFQVTRTLTKEPNTADIRIINLSPTIRSLLETTTVDAQVTLMAGYGGDNGLIFKGDVEINSQHVFPDWITFLEADDGGNAIQFDRVNLSFAGGTSLQTVIKKIAQKMRVNIGNAVVESVKGNLHDAGKEFLNGITVSGNAWKQLNRLIKSSGLEVSIQNDTLQLLEKDRPLPTTAVVLNENTGLVGSPMIGNKGEVSFRSLMNKDIFPGAQIKIESNTIEGYVRADKCVYLGQMSKQDWYIDVEGITL